MSGGAELIGDAHLHREGAGAKVGFGHDSLDHPLEFLISKGRHLDGDLVPQLNQWNLRFDHFGFDEDVIQRNHFSYRFAPGKPLADLGQLLGDITSKS